MNRFVSLLPAALALVAIGLAQPAQAQWSRGLPYFLSSNSQSSTPGTTVTAVINNSSTGHVNVTATPTSSTGSTSGSYGGSVGVYYSWLGNNPTQSVTMTSTVSLEASGTPGSYYGVSGSSNAGGERAKGDFSGSSAHLVKRTLSCFIIAAASANEDNCLITLCLLSRRNGADSAIFTQSAAEPFSSHPGGWTSTASMPGASCTFQAGTTPSPQNVVVGLGASVSAAYYNNPGSSIVTADVAFSSPVVTH